MWLLAFHGSTRNVVSALFSQLPRSDQLYAAYKHRIICLSINSSMPGLLGAAPVGQYGSRQGPRTACPTDKLCLAGCEPMKSIATQQSVSSSAGRPHSHSADTSWPGAPADDAGIAARLAKKLVEWNAPNADKLQVRC
jgi:hypothetical protein